MMSLFTRNGVAKRVETCTYPLTGRGCVSRIYSDYAVIEIGTDGAQVLETYGISRELGERTGLGL